MIEELQVLSVVCLHYSFLFMECPHTNYYTQNITYVHLLSEGYMMLNTKQIYVDNTFCTLLNIYRAIERRLVWKIN